MEPSRLHQKLPCSLKTCSGVHDRVRKILSDHAGYVLVTCRHAKKPGSMEVELSFEGDPDLASYLVYGAQGYFDNEETVGEA